MKKIIQSLCLMTAVLISASVGAQTEIKGKFNPVSKEDSIAYSIGINIGVNLKANMKKDSLNLPVSALVFGLRDALDGVENSILTDPQRQMIMSKFQKEMADKQTQRNAENAKVNKVQGQQWLEANGKKEGVKTMPSGLQYKVLREGTGVQPSTTNKVTVNYEGTLTSGKKFDSSYDRGTPATFELGKVIQGWQEGLTLMKEGAMYELYIPSDLGYGDQGYPPDIPGGSVLIFKVELIKVE